mmetsp:Transcript_23548/g.73898  ORF Transcript_23548/g.73898 Transcript_23548/m.73898 type:complete len:212 (-) Transcript_23548:166-801(-)
MPAHDGRTERRVVSIVDLHARGAFVEVLRHEFVGAFEVVPALVFPLRRRVGLAEDLLVERRGVDAGPDEGLPLLALQDRRLLPLRDVEAEAHELLRREHEVLAEDVVLDPPNAAVVFRHRARRQFVQVVAPVELQGAAPVGGVFQRLLGGAVVQRRLEGLPRIFVARLAAAGLDEELHPLVRQRRASAIALDRAVPLHRQLRVGVDGLRAP